MIRIALCALFLLTATVAACSDEVPTLNEGDPEPDAPDAGADGGGEPDADPSPDVGEPDTPPEPDPNPEPMPQCEQDTQRCVDTQTLEVCLDPLAGFEAAACPEGQFCIEDTCRPPVCEPGTQLCLNAGTAQTCEVVDGLPEPVNQDCGEGFACLEGACLEQICDPEALPTCVDQDTALFCDAPGVSTREQDCFPGQICLDAGCQTQVCQPGQSICQGDSIAICNDLGTGYEVSEACVTDDVGTTCFEGECVDACTLARLERAYVGCEYTALDLPNSSVNLNNGYGIAVANTSEDLTAIVSIETSGSIVATLTVGPRSVETHVDTEREFKLPGSGLTEQAFRVISNVPVVVYQFNSYRTIRAASTDGSLLIPDHALFNQYFAMTYEGDGGGNSEPFLAITATVDGTEVTVTPTANTAAGPGVEAINAGETLTVTLDLFDVLVLQGADGNTDLTGSLIIATAPVSVFAGNLATQVPRGRRFRDHLEQQMFPRQALGERYVVAKSAPRGENVNVPDQIRILADVDGTEVSFQPAIREPALLNTGEWIEVAITDDLEISSTAPVMVGQFFAGSNGRDTLQEGDPTFILQVPVEQYRTDYVFICPPTYTTDRVSITTPVGAQLLLDGEPVELSEEPIGDGNIAVTTLEIEDGEHIITGDVPFGISVYGYGGPPANDPNQVQNVSYGYPGGLNLIEINPKE